MYSLRSMDVLQAIPHRPPFLFVDEMVEVTEHGAIGKRVVRADEPHFAGHYPGNPIMPGVLLCETVFQTAAVYMSAKLQRESSGTLKDRTPILARIGEAKFKRIIRPGDELLIEVTYKEPLAQFHFMRGKISCGGKPVMSVEFALAMVDGAAE